MESDRQSKLTLYSLGIVVETKELKSDLIKVSPIEDLSMSNGSLSEQVNAYETNVPDSQGVKRTSKLEGGSSLIAKWIPFGHSNRMTAPDVVANETVILFRFADTDQYYWTTIFREPSLRRLESVMYGFSNLPAGMSNFDKETSYWAEVSTHDKRIQIHVAKNNGEAFGYDFIIDAATGYAMLADTAGNLLKIDGNNTENTLSNIAGTIIRQTNASMELIAPESIVEKTATKTIEVSGDLTMTASNIVINGNVTITGILMLNGVNVSEKIASC